ncbi:hypothetical protein MUN89_15620 [Halobacillus salinarum]|uniref:Lipoprotein n=1 Tax=Halobacillus salinarum TaxID=2932257 RepID=A0ABY4EGR6_9BACI|nr:hypothetical protein [Halobacillus salinarum]UOQ43339.1 hypothetical protein MUN89_15620 [Halobacillus salinarum]
MKRRIFGILFLFILCGCNTQAYNEGMEDFEKLLEDQKFDKANVKLSEVLEIKETKEAKEIQNNLESLLYAIETEEEGDLESAKLLYGDITKTANENNLKEISVIKRYSSQQQEKIIDWIMEESSVQKTIEDANSYAEENKYTKGIDLLTNLSNEKTDHPNKNSLHKKITEALTRLEDSKEAYDKEQKAKEQKEAEEQRLAAEAEAKRKAEQEAAKKAKEKEEQKQADEKTNGSEGKETSENKTDSTKSTKLTKEQAKANVVAYAQVPIENPNVVVEYELNNENGDWVYHVYEIVIDNPETKEGHTATWGWYAVDPNTGYIYNNM